MDDNKNTIIWVTTIAAIAVLAFFSVGGFLLYNSHIKNKEMEVKLRLEQEKTKQEIARSQSQQQLAQVTTASQETTTAPVVRKRRTNYEAELMNRMSSVDESLPYKAYQTWDMELNKVYKLLMSEIPENSKIKLRNSERAWLKQMVNKVNRSLDESCGVDENGKRMMCGTSDSIDEANIKFQMTKERTIELARMYDELHK
ncbi:lysozyme inhibitor LprI family protein [Leptotrichia wadei]|jgi:hypothetical protein|uniref:lysozyme inhibitor LprI family protein n=1 Tax=Leptotrichia wadei TaxID=157687 RepID=UPI0028E3DBE0|nr:lysozyme inhibitor LprI family protein [Leptotrichia wadei]